MLKSIHSAAANRSDAADGAEGDVTRARTGMASETIIEQALTAVRLLLLAVFVGSLFVGQRTITEASSTSVALGGILLGSIVAVGLANWWSRGKMDHLRGLLGILQIGADVVLALMVMFSLDAETTPLAWVALMLPVSAGWNRFSAKGAGAAWLAASICYVAVGLKFGVAPAADTSNTLYLAYQQLFAVLLIAVPALYLGSHFRSEIEAAVSAHRVAEQRAEQLHMVTVAARSMSSEDEASVLVSLFSATQRVGFAGADVVRLNDQTGRWETVSAMVGTNQMAQPQHMSPEAFETGDTIVFDQADPPVVRQALHDFGYGSAAAITLGKQTGSVLRVWSEAPLLRGKEEVAVLEALAAQAGVSLLAAGVFQEVTERSEALAYQANHDVLTGLPNRLNVLDQLDSWLHRFDPLTETIALLFLDLDGFKAANDNLGHEAGDEVLRVVAQRMKSITPRSGIVARLGGDEFVVLVEGPPGAGAPTNLGQSICDRIKEPIAVHNGIANIRASVGISVAEPGISRDVLVDRADTCMYLAKRAGGDRYEVWNGSQSLDRSEPVSAELR